MVEYQIPDPRNGKKEQIGVLVIIYKTRKGHEFDDRSWDKVHWGRCSRSASLLLEVCGGFNAAQKCLQDLCEQFDSEGFSWTLETVLKHSTEWVNKRKGVVDGKSSYARFLSAINRRKSSEGDLSAMPEAKTLLNSVGIPESSPNSTIQQTDNGLGGKDHADDVARFLPGEGFGPEKLSE